MADEQGVTSTDSPTEGTTDVTAQSSSAPGVTSTSPTDRPEKNWQSEYDRKQKAMADQLERVVMYLANGAQAQSNVRKVDRTPEPPTDEELWAQAQQGDRIAFEEYQGRIAEKKIAQNSQVTRNQQIVTGQLQALVNKYPVLNNASHPLAQTMNQAYQLLVQNGNPAGQATLLQAALTAVAERPDLVSELHTQGTQAREQVRLDSTRRAQSGQSGATFRQSSASANSKTQIAPEVDALARRMGVKDPAKAMERFRKRQESGQSRFGAVGALIPDEEN